MTAPPRVVVTGLGYVTGLGFDDADHEPALREARCAAGPVTRFDTTGFRTTIASQCDEARLARLLEERFPAARLRGLDVDTRLLLRALSAALDQAGLRSVEPPFPAVVGTTLEGFWQGEQWYEERTQRRADGARPRRLLQSSSGAQLATAAELLGVPLDPVVVSDACATGISAIGRLFRMIRSGRRERGIAAGYDCVTRFIQLGFDSLGALSAAGCSPFDRNRSGFFLGDGAAALVLESEASARARGARILAEIAGYGQSVDAYHQTRPHPEGDGVARAITQCLESAGIRPDEVDYVNAHGTATPANDGAEAKGIRRAFGEAAADRVPVSSTKALVGHTLGAAGAVEQCFSILALSRGFLPPQGGLKDPDPACPLNLVRRPEGAPRTVMNNAFGFGGANGVLLARRWE